MCQMMHLTSWPAVDHNSSEKFSHREQALESLNKMELIGAKKQNKKKNKKRYASNSSVHFEIAVVFGFAVDFSRCSLCALSLSLSLLDPQKSTWALNLIPKTARDCLFTSRSYIQNRPAGLWHKTHPRPGVKSFLCAPHPLWETLPYSISLPSSSFLFFLAVSTWTALTGETCITTTCHVTGIDCFLCLSGLQLQRRERLGYLSLVWSSLGDVLVSYTRLAERLPGLARWSSRR